MRGTGARVRGPREQASKRGIGTRGEKIARAERSSEQEKDWDEGEKWNAPRSMLDLLMGIHS